MFTKQVKRFLGKYLQSDNFINNDILLDRPQLYRGVKFLIWKHFPTQFTLSYSIFMKVWPEKHLPSLYGFKQLPPSHHCYYTSCN